ncbi:MAG: hypothetical protein H7A25_13515 [Leptospiraceae bacterium]|nr:hypothetical protein [Leptospiraceae bacterium]MCP5500920.1 hypothetical protein [Leptospiraceae bacterium]
MNVQRFTGFIFLFLIFPCSLYADNLGALVYGFLWVLGLAPLALIYSLQLIFAFYCKRKPVYSLYVKIVNYVFLIFGTVYGGFVFLFSYLLLDTHFNTMARDTFIITCIFVAIGIFAQWQSLTLDKILRSLRKPSSNDF